jgi:RNA-directed DNA polymerase
MTATVNTLCHHAAGATPAQRIETLHPLLRGWANAHRHRIWRETVAPLDRFVWRRLSRWATLRHPHTTGRWITARDLPHQPGASWRCTDPTTGKHLLRVHAAVNPQRSLKVKSNAPPCAPPWEPDCQDRDRQVALPKASACRATLLRQPTGRCPLCRQRIACEEPLERHHREGTHQHNRREKLVLLHPNGHRQGHDAPDSTTTVPRPSQGVGQA